MDFGTQDQRAGLARIVENEIVDLSLNVYGCRVVQKVNISICPFRFSLIHHKITGYRVMHRRATDSTCSQDRASCTNGRQRYQR